MGISFKVSKIGTRFRPKPSAVPEEPVLSGESSRVLLGAGSKREVDNAEVANDANGASVSSTCSGGLALSEHEVSFTLNLYQTGYIIGKPSEMENFQPHLQDAKSLHPYDRASETLFAAIESGWLPGDILDDIPSKYIDGTLVCEVRDYRKCIYEPGTAVSAVGRVPIVHKVQLRMSLENVVKDIPLISDDSWTYSDLMEVESRIVKALQPQLCLDTTPMLDRLCNAPTSSKLDLGIGRKRRLQQTPEVTVTSNYQTHGKKVCIDRLPENANGGLGERGTLLDNATIQQAHESMATQNVSRGFPSLRSNNFAQETGRPTLPLSSHHKLQPAVSYPTVVHDRSSGPPVSFAGVNTTIPSSQNLMGSFADNINGNAPPSVKRENQDAESTSLLSMKRPKQTPMRLDGVQQQQPGAQLVGLDGPDMHWKNQLLHSLDVVKGMQCSSVGGQRYPSPVMSNVPNQEAGAPFYFNQQGIRYGAKEEQADKAKMDKQELERTKDALQALVSERTVDCHQSQSQHLLQQQSMRNHLPALTQWHNARQIVEKDMRRDDILQKRKSVPSPHVSSGPMVQSPVSSKSGEISSGSVGVQFSAVATASALVSQKDKIAANSNAAVGAPSVTSSPSDSVHRQHQDSVAGKRRTNSIPKTQAMSGVGSPASVSNMSAPLNANSPSIGTAPMGDQILERFAKIKILTQKYHLNIKNNNVDDYPAMKPVSHANQQLASCFSDPFTADDFTDSTRPMSRSSLGGTINTCKTRKMCFMCTEHAYQVVPPRAQCQVTLTEKPYDGTVTMLYGDVDEFDLPNTQEFVVMLPTTHHADLLAAQFCARMEREGYQKTEDRIHPTPMRMVAPSSSMATASGVTSDNASPEVKQSEIASGQTTHVTAQANTTVMGPLNSSQNLPNSARMLASGNNSQPLQSYLPGSAMPARTQQLDQTLLQQQQQQQQHQMQQQQQQHQMQQQQQLPLPHIQRSSPLLSANPLHLMGQNSNLQIGNSPMVNNKPAASQLQILQQQTQQQQQQQSQLTRKVMMGPIGMNMGNMGNNMVGLSGLSNPMGMGGVRGISSPMGPMSGLGNISPNQMNLGSASNFSVGLRPGSRSQAEAAAIATKLRMARAGLYGHQSGIAGMVGNNNQMLSNSAGLMLGHALNRANMNPLHRNAMSSMGPPKIPGTNFYLNAQQLQQLQHPQQLQQQQLQHPQQLQQQQLQQLQQQQQQINSPLQQTQVGSPPVAGSPPAMIMQQQQISPPQMGQQPAMSPQQLSSAVLQKINCGNAVAGPASPQLSSQTHGSVGSITSSPMEQLQGANKGGSVSNV